MFSTFKFYLFYNIILTFFLFQVNAETLTVSAETHHLPRSSIFLARSEALTCPEIPEALRRKRGGVAEGKWGAGCSGARCGVERRVPRRGVAEGQCGIYKGDIHQPL